MANIWITGADGQLGKALREKHFNPLDELFFTDREVDITDPRAITDFANKNDVDTIINCAAYTNVDRAEDHEQDARAVNRDGVANLAALCREQGNLLVHLSTDYVFDGETNAPYHERHATNPLSAYGRTKRDGELAIRRSGCLHLIIRTSWLFSSTGDNFPRAILRLAAERDELRVVNDQTGSPTFAGDLADAILRLLSVDELPEYQGIYHYANAGSCSRYDLAREILALSGSTCRVIPVTTAELPARAPRPPYSVLDSRKIRDAFGLEIPDWRDALRRCFG
ncbi:MAG: dTDP-4-dehydrorhamnose reductase [Odoribacteraceae bacterium]|jgi:dTDP-4-dehydrorhamnose reductase|nr:dTDP-4-dehydrorhamnose reductase [Odoribacteraceae bacterium]